MAKDKEPLESLTEMAHQTAAEITEQTKGAMETYFNWCQKAMSASPWGNKELNKTLMNYAAENTAAAFGVVRKLSQAKNLHDAAEIQAEFVTTQLNSFNEQAKTIGEMCAKTMESATKTPGNMSM
jgi:hypothetical protein